MIIVFDIGNVLLKTSFSKIFECFNIEIESFERDIEYFEFCKGKMVSKDYFQHFIAKYKIEVDYNTFYHSWNTFFINEIEGIFEIIEELSKQHKLFALSNSNIPHAIFSQKKYKHIFDYFETTFYSFELGTRKPEKDIFEKLIHFLNSDPENIIFIDDKVENVKQALAFGIKAIQFKNSKELKQELKNYITLLN